MSTEFHRISQIRKRARRSSGAVSLGIGDDAALVRVDPACEAVVSTDLLVEDIHFKRAWATPELLGRKAIAVALSDLAAMGATPRAAFVSIAIPRTCDDSFLEDFYTGFLSLADRFQVTIAGGDLSASPGPVFVDSIVVGQVELGRALRRSGARPGDDLYVSGTLGSSAAGLSQLLSGVTPETASTGLGIDAIRAHLTPMPRVELGRALVTSGIASAAIDISDGLSSDLAHVCLESHVGAVVHASTLPTRYGLETALHGGEQYELLFAAAPADADRIKAISAGLKLPITPIGHFDGAAGEIWLEQGATRSRLVPHGWDHFRFTRPVPEGPGE